MKKREFNNLPAGSIVLAKKYNLWDRCIAWLTKKSLKYNDAWVDPFGRSGFLFKNTLFTKYDVYTFIPKKKYSNKEKIALFEKVLPKTILLDDPVEAILLINTIRPGTFEGTTLEELLDNNKYYVKNQVK